jgi:hypothetical protein
MHEHKDFNEEKHLQQREKKPQAPTSKSSLYARVFTQRWDFTDATLSVRHLTSSIYNGENLHSAQASRRKVGLYITDSSNF